MKIKLSILLICPIISDLLVLDNVSRTIQRQQSCREPGMIGGIFAMAVWILARATLLFAKAY